MDAPIPVLLDTDIGSDIDDAVALAYLLLQPRCELLGVTTVTGDVSKRAALAQAICDAAGRHHVPIRAGVSAPLSGPGQPDVPQYAAIGQMASRHDWPEGEAIAFLGETIRSRPGEVVLLSIGPLTNLALLFEREPGLAGLLRAWVSMAGIFKLDPARFTDWNSVCDPRATELAFRARPRRHVHVGLDVTLRCRLSADEVRQRFQGPVLGLVREMAEVWFKSRESIVFHDPLAAALVFAPELCKYERGVVTIEPGTARTLFTPDRSGTDDVAVEVNAPAYFSEFFRLCGAPI